MVYELSDDQKKVADCKTGLVVVKASPGSGKTFSVAARVSSLLKNESFYASGIACLSFTNVACDEISATLKRCYSIQYLQFPHFIGTIDKFINTHIFLPYGHLYMNCPRRPELVGEPHKAWTKGKGDQLIKNGIPFRDNPDAYFDFTSFDLNNELIPIVSPMKIHVSLAKDSYYNKDGTIKKKIQKIIQAKYDNFKLGYANQSDANYISLKILEKYPLIKENLAGKYKYFIIDEAQDTDEIQMRIFDLLNHAGAGNIMFIGDRDQSIFEWKSANPKLFDKKYMDWNKMTLNENRRSSQLICNFTNSFSSFDRSYAINPAVRNYDHAPEIMGYNVEKKTGKHKVALQDSVKSLIPAVQHFFATCEQHSIKISQENVAVLFRSWKMGEYFGIRKDYYDHERNPWVKHHYHVKDILKGFVLCVTKSIWEGYRIIERAYYEAIFKENDPDFHCSRQFIETKIENEGLRAVRDEVFGFIRLLPGIRKMTILEWVTQTNGKLMRANIHFQLKVERKNASILIEDYFAGEIQSLKRHPFYCGTIHSIKGKTFDAIFLLVGKTAVRTNYVTFLKNGMAPYDQEELRNIYVAITRPRKILMMAVPEEDLQNWKAAFGKKVK